MIEPTGPILSSMSACDATGADANTGVARGFSTSHQVNQAIVHPLLCAWCDIEQADQPNFFEWHDREHIAERVTIPGFLLGRRFQALDRQNHFLILYDVTTLAVLESGAYLDRHHHLTSWSQLTRPVIRNLQRVFVHPMSASKIGDGGFVYTLQLTIKEPSALTETMNDQIGWILRQSGILAAYLGRFGETIEAEQHSTSYVLIVEAISLWHLTAFAESQTFTGYWPSVGAVTTGRSESFVLQACVRPEICASKRSVD
jgi:hypothetical protein